MPEAAAIWLATALIQTGNLSITRFVSNVRFRLFSLALPRSRA